MTNKEKPPTDYISIVGRGGGKTTAFKYHIPENLKNVICPQCKKPFRLFYDDCSNESTLIIRGCPSGGIYDVAISCPYCDYEENL